MTKKTLTLSVGMLLAFSQLSSAQHSITIDAGGGKYAQLVASSSLPVGVTTFSLDNGSGTVVTSANIFNYAWVLGGNPSPVSNLLGTTSNTDLDFVTGASGPNRRMRITSGGNVQIGSGGTPNLFEVDGATGNLSKIRNVDLMWPASNPGAAGFLRNDGSGGLSWTTSVNADRSAIGNWYEVNVGSGTLNQIVDVAGAGGGGITEFAVPFAGSITGIAVTLENDCSGGTFTCEVLINGAATGLIATITNTGGGSDKYAFAAQGVGLDNFAAGDRIQVRFSTTAGYGANGDAYFTVYGNF